VTLQRETTSLNELRNSKRSSGWMLAVRVGLRLALPPKIAKL